MSLTLDIKTYMKSKKVLTIYNLFCDFANWSQQNNQWNISQSTNREV